MGSFYTSHILKGPSQEAVLSFLEGRPAFVSIQENGIVVVLDKQCESQDGQVLAQCAARLSAQFHCPAMALLNHDDDILYFELYEDGQKTDEYNSSPGYFGNEVDEEGPSGGNSVRLAKVFGVNDPQKIEGALRQVDYVFAMERHHDLASALGLPEFSVGLGYSYLSSEGQIPDEIKGIYVHSEV